MPEGLLFQATEQGNLKAIRPFALNFKKIIDPAPYTRHGSSNPLQIQPPARRATTFPQSLVIAALHT